MRFQVSFDQLDNFWAAMQLLQIDADEYKYVSRKRIVQTGSLILTIVDHPKLNDLKKLVVSEGSGVYCPDQ